ncbi:hypothetical protein AVEN_196368-1 [Araneus ventricosus]|uniref:Uncharacterized protein n=1 Tax=Araneus ventricosus TaxID=182803 RepID=A0A4Y2AUZ9_ARAVE|nr:hypothetical protein AVEN_196368-1 [Araneus ventricosus]
MQHNRTVSGSATHQMAPPIRDTTGDDAWARAQRTALNESVEGGSSSWRCKRPRQNNNHIGMRNERLVKRLKYRSE